MRRQIGAAPVRLGMFGGTRKWRAGLYASFLLAVIMVGVGILAEVELVAADCASMGTCIDSVVPNIGPVAGGTEVTIVFSEPLPRAKVIQVSGGYDYSIAIDSNGRLYGWGNNGYGKMGDGTTTARSLPIKIMLADDVRLKYIAAGENHSLGISRGGDLYAWGAAANGRLGNGTTAGNVTSPTKIVVAGEPKFVKVDSVDATSVALDEEGKIWVWGSGANGALGNGLTSGNRMVPEVLDNFVGIVPVFIDVAACSYTNYSFLAVDVEGNIWGWGRNDYGSLGLGNNNVYSSPVKIYDAASGAWTASAAASLTAGTKMATVATGWGVGGAMDENGSIYTWGANNQGELGVGSYNGGHNYVPVRVYDALTGSWTAASTPDFGAPRRMVKFETGAAWGVVVDELGNVFSWGNNDDGQLGIGNTSDRAYPTQIYNSSTGLFVGGVSLPVGTKMIGAGGYRDYQMLLSEDGDVFGTGHNGVRQLGDGTNIRRVSAVIITTGIAGSVFPIMDWEEPEVYLGGAVCVDLVIDVNGTFVVCETTAHVEEVVDVVLEFWYSDNWVMVEGFYYRAPMVISAISPPSGVAEGGDEVIILGHNLQPPSGMSPVIVVTFDYEGTGAVCVDVVVIDNDTISCTTSAYINGLVSVRVENDYDFDVMAAVADVGANGMPVLDSSGRSTGGFYYYEIYLSLSWDEVAFSVSPSAMGSGFTTVTVETTNPTGYVLSMEADGEELACKDNSAYTIPSIAAAGALAVDSWGWNFAEHASLPAAPVSWKPVPLAGSSLGEKLISTAGVPTVPGDSFDLWFGARMGWTTRACEYQQMVRITAVGGS